MEGGFLSTRVRCAWYMMKLVVRYTIVMQYFYNAMINNNKKQ